MRIPAFVPLVANERRRREWTGFAIEIVLWGYAAVVFARIVLGHIVFSLVEDLAYREEPFAWALALVKWTEYETRYPGFSWGLLGLIFLVGSLIGVLVGLTGKGMGTWLASISKLQVNTPEDSIKIEKHWKYAKIESYIVLLLTFVAGWIMTKIELGKLFDADGLLGAGRLLLGLSCGIPGVGDTNVLFGASSSYTIYESLRHLLNLFVGWANHFRAGAEALPQFSSTCVPSTLAYYGEALTKLSESIYLAFMATVLSIPPAFVLSFFAARNLTRHSRWMRFIYTLNRMYMNVTRSIEPLIWAVLFSVWIGIGPFAGSIALFVHSISSLVKQYSEAVETIDEGPVEALTATGANRVATVWYAVVPQIVLPYLAFTIFRWDINVRMATVIGLVGGGGIGQMLIQEQGLANYTGVGTLAFLIFIVVWAMDFLSARIREAIQ